MFQDHKVAYLRQHVKVRRTVPFTMLRSSLAYVLGLGAREIPHIAFNTELDVTPVAAYCEQREGAFEGNPARVRTPANFSAFFTKAVSHALYHTPCMNSFLDHAPIRNGGTLYHAEDINLGFNVNTKYGAVRPVYHNAHLKPMDQVVDELRDIIARARNSDPEELFQGAARLYLWPSIKELDWRALYPGYILLRARLFNRHKPDPEYLKIPPEKKLAAHEILGATCSITNVGMAISGQVTVTALTPPETMMFGLGDLHVAPRYVDGELVPRTVVSLCCTADHRAFDGGECFPFFGHLDRYIQNPARIYEWQPGDEI